MQLFPLKLIPLNPQIDFIGIKKITYGISIFLVCLSISFIAISKFNFGIDFIGGISMEVRTDQEPDLPKMREILSNINIGEVVLQNFGTSKDLSIKVGVNSEENLMNNITLIKKSLEENFPYNFEYRKIDFVGPQVGNQMINAGIMAMLLSFGSIMLYVWVRFEWQFGIGVLVALVHDVVLSLGFMSITKYDFNLSTIAAILTIIGYSVNDSVVIYDRIRDNLRKFSRKTVDEIINSSINETLSRTTITALTTLLANLALIILGGEAIRSFSILVFFGIFVGTCSSIFISAPILTLFNLKNLKE
ncbi:MAG: protein translocase subunit SecF [Rickettsiales bacterium]|nr:MAG: protein translocase subunit SecF [Rickettsiales bacterium]